MTQQKLSHILKKVISEDNIGFSQFKEHYFQIFVSFVVFLGTMFMQAFIWDTLLIEVEITLGFFLMFLWSFLCIPCGMVLGITHIFES